LLKNEIFGLFKVVRRHCAGEVGKFTTTSRQIFTWCCVPKIIQIAQFLTELFPKQKGGRFFETQCIIFIMMRELGDCHWLYVDWLALFPGD